MSDYRQPEFYRFNEDSLKLVSFVVSQNFAVPSLLDLGAGCGIIGIELSLRIPVRELTLVEIQADFIPFIDSNLKLFSRSANIHHLSFSQFHSETRFDLIVCNPPYYLAGAGQSSTDERRGICRSFVKDSWKDLLSCIDRSLANQGQGYLVIKNRSEILTEIRTNLPSTLVLKLHEAGDDLLFLSLTRLNVERDEHRL
jgi:tRNA1Val (adenine37-N6)-methyltransferase